MTIYKRIGILISVLLLLLLGAVLTINFINSKGYIEEQLNTNAKNSAMALSLALSIAKEDEEQIKSLIDSVFSRGSYEMVELEDSNRMPIYRKTRSPQSDDVPLWFKRWFPINTVMAEVLVSMKNQPLGVLMVKADSSIAYRQLYSLFKYTVLMFLLFGAFGLLLLRSVLKIVLKSLDKIREQAEGVLHNKFVIQKELPSTVELKEITEVMNSMVKRVKELFQRSSEAMRKNQEILYRDPLTKLFNRRYFQVKLPEYLLANDSRSRGTLVMIRINGISKANKKIGHKRVDEFFEKFAEILQKACESVHEPSICRINGTEIILILPVFNAETAKELVRNIMKNALVLTDSFNLRESVYFSFGITEYVRNEPVAKLLASADYALSDAALYKENHITVFTKEKKSSLVLGKSQWREIISSALKNGKLEPELSPVINLKKDEKVAYTISFDIRHDSYSYRYGDYLPAIVDLGLEHDLVMYELEYLKQHRFTHNALSLEIFAQTLIDSNKYIAFEESIKEVVKVLKGKLFIEISEFDILSLDPAVAERITFTLKEHGIRFGIDRFSGEQGGYTYLKYTAPAYIKMHETLYLDMDGGSKNALLTLLGSLDIKLIVTGVHEENINILREEGVHYIMPAQ